MKTLRAALMMLGLAMYSALSYAAGQVQVRDAWIPEAPPVADVMAAYFVIENHGDKPVTISGASSPAFGMVMMHKSVDENGMVRMIHQDHLTVAANSQLAFARSGLHLMLMSPKHPLKLGDKVELTLHTADHQQIHFTAIVKAATLGDDHPH